MSLNKIYQGLGVNETESTSSTKKVDLFIFLNIYLWNSKDASGSTPTHINNIDSSLSQPGHTYEFVLPPTHTLEC